MVVLQKTAQSLLLLTGQPGVYFTKATRNHRFF